MMELGFQLALGLFILGVIPSLIRNPYKKDRNGDPSNGWSWVFAFFFVMLLVAFSFGVAVVLT